MSGHKMKVVSRKTVYKGKSFKVAKYTCEVDGELVNRDVMERKPGVVIVAVDPDDSVVMVSEYCAGSNSFVLSLPGGSIDSEDDDPQTAALRELREETGLGAGRIEKLRYAYEHPSTSDRRVYVFLATELEPAPLPSSHEIIDLVRMPLDRAIEASYRDFESDMSTIGCLLMARDRLSSDSS